MGLGGVLNWTYPHDALWSELWWPVQHLDICQGSSVIILIHSIAARGLNTSQFQLILVHSPAHIFANTSLVFHITLLIVIMTPHSSLFRELMDASMRAENYMYSTMTGLQRLTDLDAKQRLAPRFQ